MTSISASLHLKYKSLPKNLHCRPASRADASAILRLHTIVNMHDEPDRVVSLQDVLNDFDDPYAYANDDSLLVLDEAENVIALMWVFVPPTVIAECPATLVGVVHPAYRRQGVGHFILSWAETRATERLASYAGQPIRRLLRVGCRDSLADRRALFAEYGYVEVRSLFRMWRDLREPIPHVFCKPQIVLREFAPELSQAAMHAYDESFEDHWGHQPLTQEEWRIFYTHNPDFRPDLTTIAYDTMRNEVAGICIIKASQDEIDRTGIKICYLPTIGTRRGWRKMGIGTTMLCDAMRKARAAGFDYVRLGVDSDNPSGALRLYQRFGFYVLWRWLWLEKDLAL